MKFKLPLLALSFSLAAAAAVPGMAADAPPESGKTPAGASQAGASPECSVPTADGAVKAVALMHPAAAATTQPSNRNVSGTITFTQSKEGVAFVAEIDGFEPDSRHAFHIHETADLSKPDLTSAGKQWKPAARLDPSDAGDKGEHAAAPHADAPAPPTHSMSDLGALAADGKGHAHFEGLIVGATITGGENPIAGHAVIIHANPPGKAGARIAGGAIEIVKS